MPLIMGAEYIILLPAILDTYVRYILVSSASGGVHLEVLEDVVVVDFVLSTSEEDNAVIACGNSLIILHVVDDIRHLQITVCWVLLGVHGFQLFAKRHPLQLLTEENLDLNIIWESLSYILEYSLVRDWVFLRGTRQNEFHPLSWLQSWWLIVLPSYQHASKLLSRIVMYARRFWRCVRFSWRWAGFIPYQYTRSIYI